MEQWSSLWVICAFLVQFLNGIQKTNCQATGQSFTFWLIGYSDHPVNLSGSLSVGLMIQVVTGCLKTTKTVFCSMKLLFEYLMNKNNKLLIFLIRMLELPPTLTKKFGLEARSFSTKTVPKTSQDKSWTRAPTDGPVKVSCYVKK